MNTTKITIDTTAAARPHGSGVFGGGVWGGEGSRVGTSVRPYAAPRPMMARPTEGGLVADAMSIVTDLPNAKQFRVPFLVVERSP